MLDGSVGGKSDGARRGLVEPLLGRAGAIPGVRPGEVIEPGSLGLQGASLSIHRWDKATWLCATAEGLRHPAVDVRGQSLFPVLEPGNLVAQFGDGSGQGDVDLALMVVMVPLSPEHHPPIDVGQAGEPRGNRIQRRSRRRQLDQ